MLGTSVPLLSYSSVYAPLLNFPCLEQRLAAALVEQRSEVEQYFLDALEDCKTEIRKRRREQEYNEGTGRSRAPSPGISTGSRFPPIPSDKTMGTDDSQRSIGADAAAARVDIADLTWEDKERVLRLLFARINRATGRVSLFASCTQSITCR